MGDPDIVGGIRRMMIMPANNTSGLVHYLAGRAPGSIGHLYTPNRTERPKSWLPYCLDNGAFAAKINGREFDWDAWHVALDRYTAHPQAPIWLVVPDVVFDGTATLEQWNQLAERYRKLRVPLALAVQDGITPDDVRGLAVQPDVIFIGGSTDWKWDSLASWCGEFSRVHVARVNGRKGLDAAYLAGAESCDGSGWFRGDVRQLLDMCEFIADTHGLPKNELREATRSLRHSREAQLVLRLDDDLESTA